jgi:hypothetical protein
MNQNETYFSEEEEDDQEEIEELEEYEIDDDIRISINNAILRNMERLEKESTQHVKQHVKPLEKKITSPKIKKDKKLTRLDLSVKEIKSTKFISKRMEEKKESLGLNNKTVYRVFNPRKPPYLQVYNKINNNKVLDENDFPTL